MDNYGEPLRLDSPLTDKGHVIGLLHEQQRPDASRFVKFDCRSLTYYKEAKTVVESVSIRDEPAFTAQMSTDEKIDLVFAFTFHCFTSNASANNQ